MNDITENFGTLYCPQAAIILYQSRYPMEKNYVEAYEIDDRGCAINGHPLTVQEAAALAKVLDTSGELNNNFLQPKGILPAHVLHLAPGDKGYVLWHTPAMTRTLCFTESLGLTDGQYALPPMLWKATKQGLQVFALKAKGRPTLRTPLYEAPFFNIYANGRVCMGTVDIRIPPDTSMEAFMKIWEDYFFKSRFSHLLGQQSPVKGNIIDLFQQLHGGREKFPTDILRKHSLTLQNLIR